jgi:hypothetical protein
MRHIFFSLIFLFSLSLPSHAIIRMVENLNDSGTGSLRANLAMTANGDTIQFEVNGTIALTSGKLNVQTAILIDGPGMDLLTITSGGNFTVFDVNNASAHIRGLTVEDAEPMGVYVHGAGSSFMMENVRIQNCYNETSSASGLFVAGISDCTFLNCEILNNTVYGDGRRNRG